ncbi:cytosine permease [Candidatus Regiella endosymbiont of Tuberolachnus salignus]|uniref:purine-cytosine permease family protein n=1 Tax=Candidatus Regiella endosymbiont of Tuberolachnus salignus TaxID=3077956 RepID=UPI0030CB5389
MRKNNIISDDYAVSRVPLKARASLLSTTLIRVGAMTALSQFLIGATLGHSMTFGQAVLATFIGSLLLEFVSLGLGIAGAREGMSTSLLARWCGFGRFGSVLIGMVIAISFLGWFGVQNSISAKGLNYAFNDQLGFTWSAIISGIALTVLVAFGFRALSWTAIVSVPVFFLVIGWIATSLLMGHNITDLISIAPSGTPFSLGTGVMVVAGGAISGALITPDISRYCKNGRHAFWMITLSIIASEFIVNTIAILIAHALDTSDVVTIMTQSAGWIGLLAVILAVVKVNDVNLYSSSLALANAIECVAGKRLNHVGLIFGLGIAGTILSIAGILDNFLNFLILMGVVFPPVAGVILVDYYILRTSRKLLDTTRDKEILPTKKLTPSIGWPAIISWVAGSVVGLVIEWGIPSLNALLVASVIYWTMCTVRKVRSTKMR